MTTYYMFCTWHEISEWQELKILQPVWFRYLTKCEKFKWLRAGFRWELSGKTVI